MSPLRFLANAISHHPLKTGSIFLGDVLQAVFTLMIPYAVKNLIDGLDQYDAASGQQLAQTLSGEILFFIGLVIALHISSRMSGLSLAFLAPVFRIKPRESLIKVLQSQAMDFFQNRHSGSLGNRINEVCNGMSFGLWTFVFDIVPVLIKVVTGVILFVAGHSFLGFILMGWAFIYLTGSFSAAYFQFIYSEKISRARSKISGKVVDMATNIYAVKSYAREKHEQNIIDETSIEERHVVSRLQIFREGGAIFQSLMTIGIMIFMVVSCVDAFERGEMTLGDISFVLTMLLILTESFNGFAWSVTHFLEYAGQMREGLQTIHSKPSLVDKDNAKSLEIANPSVCFEGVVFGYPEVDIGRVFDGLDLKIGEGEKIGLVGMSGAGKSTLVSLLMRFYDVDDGSIKIDGQNIADVTQSSLRRHIAVIPQDTSLFHRTLIENIRYGRLEASDEEVIEAAKKAHAHDFIKELPQGYDTLVGERGVKLSGGQRQRIAIARAILKDAPILILDEATSALDSESEKLIQDSLKDLMRGKTVIAIAHRLSTIAHLDRLIVMESGTIIEDGTHDTLISTKDGHYAKLWAMQSGGFIGK